MNLFIASSSSDEIPENYFIDCEKLLNKLLKKNNLVFGTSTTGLMGLSYRIAKKNNRTITGLCTEYYKKDLLKLNCNIEEIVKTTDERTNRIFEISDALIFLPGGIGTITELLMAIEKKRNNEINKPIIIYNLNNYFEDILHLFNRLYTEKFTSKEVENIYYVSNSIEDTLKYLGYVNKEKI